MNARRTSALILVILGSMFAGTSCDTAVVPQISILSGTWLLTADELDTFLDKTLEINDDGHLIKITTRVDNFGTEQRIVQTNVDRATSVDGDNLRIEIPGDIVLGFTGNLVFEGTLDADHNRADGRLQTESDVFGTIVITDKGAGTIVRQ